MLLQMLRSSCFPWSLFFSVAFHAGLFVWAWLYWATTELPALYAPSPGVCTIGLLPSVAPSVVEVETPAPPPTLPVLAQMNFAWPDVPRVPTQEQITEKLQDLKKQITERAVKKLTELKAEQPKKEETDPQPEAIDSTNSAASDGARVDEYPSLPNQTPPRYPADLLAAGIEGRVLVRVLVRPDGTAATAHVQESSGWKKMDDSALEAIRGWRFRPARRGGMPVPCEVDIPVRFYIGNR